MQNHWANSTRNCKKGGQFREEKTSPPWKSTGSHLHPPKGQTGRTGLRTATQPPPYLSDLGLHDNFVFKLENSFVLHKFESNEKVFAAMEGCFADLKKIYFSDVLKKLEHRWITCILLKGGYIKNSIATFQKFRFLLLDNYLLDHRHSYWV